MNLKIILGIFCLQIQPLLSTRVLVIGIDGFDSKCKPDLPNIDRLVAEGSSTYTARTNLLAISSPGWTSMLCSMNSADSGVLDNDFLPPWILKWKNPISSTTKEKPFKCIYENVKTQIPGSKIYAYYDWFYMTFLGRFGIGYVDFETLCLSFQYFACDQFVTYQSTKAIEDRDFTLLFNYYVSLDETGHAEKFCSKKYIEHMKLIDEEVGTLLSSLKRSGLAEETVVVLTSDHGASSGTNHHGDRNDENIRIPVIFKGPGIKKGYKIQANTHITDIAPTISRILGIKPDPIWIGREISEIFEDKGEEKLM